MFWCRSCIVLLILLKGSWWEMKRFRLSWFWRYCVNRRGNCVLGLKFLKIEVVIDLFWKSFMGWIGRSCGFVWMLSNIVIFIFEFVDKKVFWSVLIFFVYLKLYLIFFLVIFIIFLWIVLLFFFGFMNLFIFIFFFV